MTRGGENAYLACGVVITLSALVKRGDGGGKYDRQGKQQQRSMIFTFSGRKQLGWYV